MPRESQGNADRPEAGPRHEPPPLLLANPTAGAGRAERRLRQLLPLLNGWPVRPEIRWSRSAAHLRELAAEARETSRGLVVAAGGDGTAHDVVNGMLSGSGGAVPDMGFLPLGTSGDFGRSLGLPPDARQVARNLLDWPRHTIDLGRAELDAGGRVYFLNFANVGIAVRVAERVARSRGLRRLGRLSYVAAAAMDARRRQPLEIRLVLDGGDAWEGRVAHLSIGNGAYFGGGLRPITTASLQSGSLHLLRLGDVGQLTAIRELARALRGIAPAHPTTAVQAVASVRVEGDSRVEIDGQLPGRLPGEFSVEARALGVRCPVPVPGNSRRPV